MVDGHFRALNMASGGITKAEIQAKAERTNLGDVVEFKAVTSATGGTLPVKKKGVVVGKYPSHVLVDLGAYRECALWIDVL